MRITAKQLRKLLREASASGLSEDHDHYDEYEDEDDSEFFLHGYEDGHAQDAEGSMAKSQLHRVKEIAYMLCDMLEEDDQLPAWVQAHITTAYENLNQVLSYMEPKMHMHDDDEDEFEDDYEEDMDDYEEVEEELDESLWKNVWARRRAGKPPLKPGQKGYPKTLRVGKKKKKK